VPRRVTSGTSLRVGLFLLGGVLLASPATAILPAQGSVVFASGGPSSEEKAIQKVLESYVHAIESRDLTLFKAVKPNLSPDEERRARKAFESLSSQAVVMTINMVEVREAEAVVRVSRRDTINGSIVSSFPQTFSMVKGKDGWSIRDITR
jgi:NurA-like 5'-3' nuclease